MLYIIIFSKNKKRTEANLGNVFESIQKKFLNLAECREYDIFTSKYYESFENDFNKLLDSYKNDMFFYFRIYNNHRKFTASFNIFNKDKKDYFLSKVIKAEECILYLVLAKAQ
jgi:hypothetical protein